MLDWTRKACFRLKLEKCYFGVRSVELLGHRVSFGEVRPSDDHTDVFGRYREPINAAELLRFMGLVGFCRERGPFC